MKHIAHILLGCGFLTAAFIATREIDRVTWLHYGAAAAVALVGLVLVHLSNRRQKAGQSERLGADIEVLAGGLKSLVDKLDQLLTQQAQLQVYDVYPTIDAKLRDDLSAVAEARMALVPLYGMQRYADLMTEFAGSERLINRAWSASADGYVDEVWLALKRATAQMHQARTLLEQYRSTGSAS